MNLNIIIIDDELIFSNTLKDSLETWSTQSNVSLDISCFSSGEDFFLCSSVPPYHDIQAFFLDIELPGMNGMEIAEKLRSQNYSGTILFLTNYSDYVFKGYDVNALQYMLKPLHQDRITKCMNQILNAHSSTLFSYMYRNSISQISYDQILYFTSSNHNIDIHALDSVVSFNGKFRELIPMLPPFFKQCHRTTLVNIHHIMNLKGKDIYLSNKELLPVSKTFLMDIQHALLRNLM